MNNKERLSNLKEALRLIREVEFSYPPGDPIRQMIYSVVVDRFSLTHLGDLMMDLKLEPEPTKISCPKCDSSKLIVERRPNGNAECSECGWKGEYKECFD